MSQLEIDKRTIEDIIEQIRTKAAVYTPEWRFDTENRDVGSALAMIYADMLRNTISRLNNVPQKNKIAFYNQLGTQLRTAVPAEGYVTFALVNDEVSGTAVPKGTQLFADVEDKERIVFETIDDVYVSNTRPCKMFSVNSKKDYIAQIYDEEKDGEKNLLNRCEISLFGYREENLQRHFFTISHPSVFHIKTEGEIILHFKLKRTEMLDGNFKKALLDGENVCFEYLTQSGYQKFRKIRFEGNYLVLYKTKEMESFCYVAEETDEGEQCRDYIRCTVKDIQLLKNMQLDKLYIRSQGKMIAPELVLAAGNEYCQTPFYAFGERPTLMQEVYFVSEEVLSKKGAFVHLNFDLEYGKFEIENDLPMPEYSWKNIMKKSDFKVDPEYDITVSEVVWEYYNGTGWTRLFPTEMYTDIFNASRDSFTNVTVNFQCPEDIEPFLVSSITSYSIRARVLKMNNLYKMRGFFIAPHISRVRFKYEYINNKIPPTELLISNNLMKECYSGEALTTRTKALSLFKGVEDEEPTVYVGLQRPLLEGPVKLMFMMNHSYLNPMPIMKYEYWAGNRWNELNMVDETEHFKKTGLLTMMGNEDFEKKVLFGEELYWIRFRDIHVGYEEGEPDSPVVSGMYMNTTHVRAVRTMPSEYFDIRANEENLVCELSGNNLHSVEVWVDEKSDVNNEGMRTLAQKEQVRYEYTDEGQIEKIWVKWKAVPQFDATLMEERVYVVDHERGRILFSDGRQGRIPPSGEEPTILVEYTCGGGKAGNIAPMLLNKLNSTIGFVGSVNNYDSTMGGCDRETVTEAVNRKALSLRHGYRAVTATDYENLAMEAGRNILKAKCCANCTATGKKEFGYVTLVLLLREYRMGWKYFDYTRKVVEEYLKRHMNEQLFEQQRFKIIEPEYIVINVNITIVVKEYNKVFEVKEKVSRCIEEFLDPVEGNFDGKGWNIGESPSENQVQNAVKDIKDIVYIKNVRIDAYGQGSDGRVEIDYERHKMRPFVLPVNGEHRITIDVE